MPVLTRGQEAHHCAEAAGATDVLALIFERLPPGDQHFTISRLSKEWRRWAAERAAGLPERARSATWDSHSDFAVPLWFIKQSWPRLRPYGRRAALRRAAWHGDLPALEWMSAAGCSRQELDDASVCVAAAFRGHLAVLQWARRLRCPWYESTCSEAARGGHLEVLQWARRHGCPWDDRTSRAAAKSGHLAVLQWARQHGCPWVEWTCAWAAHGGHLAVLQWARQHGCPWDDSTCSSAARGGHLEVLQWARQHGCPWDEWTCSVAAGGGHLDVLQWARQHGCPWDKRTCTEAAGGGHLEVLQWARQHGCPWDVDEALRAAGTAGHDAVTKWLLVQRWLDYEALPIEASSDWD